MEKTIDGITYECTCINNYDTNEICEACKVANQLAGRLEERELKPADFKPSELWAHLTEFGHEWLLEHLHCDPIMASTDINNLTIQLDKREKLCDSMLIGWQNDLNKFNRMLKACAQVMSPFAEAEKFIFPVDADNDMVCEVTKPLTIGNFRKLSIINDYLLNITGGSNAIP